MIIACGGCNNINPVKEDLGSSGCICNVIKTVVTWDPNSLGIGCIELYIPLFTYNTIFGLSANSVPEDKNSFFESVRMDTISDETVKRFISDQVNSFLTIDNSIVSEIITLIE